MAPRSRHTEHLTPIARVVGQTTSGLEPKLVLMTPVDAVRKLLTKVGWIIEDVDLFELNEAFAVQAVAVIRELGLAPAGQRPRRRRRARPRHRSSGARILTTLLYALKRLGKNRGIATLCFGGGNGVAWRWSSHDLHFGVIGAGTMGNGIAQAFAQSGFEVRLNDAAPPRSIARARRSKRASASSSRRQATAADRDAALGRVSDGAARRPRGCRLRRRGDRRGRRPQARRCSRARRADAAGRHPRPRIRRRFRSRPSAPPRSVPIACWGCTS